VNANVSLSVAVCLCLTLTFAGRAEDAGLEKPVSEDKGHEVAIEESPAEPAWQAEDAAYGGRRGTGIRGNRLWFVDAGAILNASDDDGLDLDPGPAFATGYNFPLGERVDLGLGVSYSQQSGRIRYYKQIPYTVYDPYYDGSIYYYLPRTAYESVLVDEDYEATRFSGDASLSLSLYPGKPVNPYLTTGGLYLSQDIEIGDSSDRTGDWGLLAGAGVEFMLGQKASLIPSAIYSTVDDVDETSFNLFFSHWYADNQAWRLGAGYGTEAKSILARVGWMW
jgi:hypothetical protein